MTAPQVSAPTPTHLPRATLRLASLLAACWRVNLAEELQYRGNFVASLLSTIFWLGTAMLTLALFFGHASRLGGWDFWEVVVLLGVFNTLTGVIETVLRPGIGRRIGVWHVADIVLGLGLTVFALLHLGKPVSLSAILSFALTLASAVAVVYAIWVALMSLAFWFVAVENISVLFDGVYQAARYPVSAYPGALRFLFVYLIPIAWTTTIPASALTGRLGWPTAASAVGVAAVSLALTRLLWNAALRRYTSAGG
jgi:ABC-2 type transport system permease protein